MRVAALPLAAVIAASGVLSGCWLQSSDRDRAAGAPTTSSATPGVGTPTDLDRPPVAGAAGVGDRYFPRYGNGGYNVAHYRLRLSYNPATDRLQGTATIDARAGRPLRSFNLDLVGLTVQSISVDGSPARWRRGSHELTVTPAQALPIGAKFRTVVRYSGRPEAGFRATNDGALVAGQPESAAYWFPVNDHPTDKATYTFVVTVPDGLVAVANGVLDSHRDNTWTWLAREPMASYLATVAIGDFDLRSYQTVDGLLMWDAVDRSIGSRADSALDRQGEIIDFLADRFGDYPFEAGGAIVDDHRLGFALETQTRPVYPAGFFGGQPGEEMIIVHEVAHQWFGDYVSVARWRDIVLNEGFATYAEWLWMEEAGYATAQQAFDFFYRGMPSSHPFWSVRLSDPGVDDLFDVAVYWRGAMWLHQLRRLVGDEDFFAIVRQWVSSKAHDHGSLTEFTKLAEQVSGRDVDPLFRRWLEERDKPTGSGSTAGPPSALGERVLEGRSRGLIDV
ncbi:MAG: M1 family metallopeptidase [Sporichthyaceae bacterium]|nr:M1 family metallopeptidase [Sporichthyaceae bacterium]